jgi:hypothetical protein
MGSASLAIIEAFAKALDEDDYDLATSLLSAECTYELTGQTLEGRSAVINSFRPNSEWTHTNLDEVVFVHSIEDCHDCTSTIRFVDLIKHKDKRLRHECLMHTIVTSDGFISRAPFGCFEDKGL